MYFAFFHKVFEEHSSVLHILFFGHCANHKWAQKAKERIERQTKLGSQSLQRTWDEAEHLMWKCAELDWVPEVEQWSLLIEAISAHQEYLKFQSPDLGQIWDGQAGQGHHRSGVRNPLLPNSFTNLSPSIIATLQKLVSFSFSKPSLFLHIFFNSFPFLFHNFLSPSTGVYLLYMTMKGLCLINSNLTVEPFSLILL